MDNIANILLWIGIIAGGLMVLLLLLSMLSGLDLDGDVDVDVHADVHADGGDVDAGGLGLLKSGLTLFSIGSFTARAIVLNSDWSWPIAITSGIIAGIIAIILLSQFLKLLLRQQEEGNYEFWEAEGKIGKVYVPIPKDGIGKITIEINGVNREIPARCQSEEAIGSNEKVVVVQAEEDWLIVTRVS